jgi:hypothetical protein
MRTTITLDDDVAALVRRIERVLDFESPGALRAAAIRGTEARSQRMDPLPS